MALVSHRSRRLHPVVLRIFRLVALLAWVGQLAVVGASCVEALTDAAQATHVESHSDPLHHAHNPDLCPGCVALALVGIPAVGRPPIPGTEGEHVQPDAASLAYGGGADALTARPRAPPVWESTTRSLPRLDSDSHTQPTHAIRTLAVRAPRGRDGYGGHRTRAARRRRSETRRGGAEWRSRRSLEP